MNAGGGDKNVSFCFFKHDERQEMPQQNNLPDKNHNTTDRGEKRGEERRGGNQKNTK